MIYAQLVAKEIDLMGYVTFVFKNLEKAPFGNNYVMCVMFKNWEHKPIDIGEIGYLSYRELQAGVDKWYDVQSGQFIPYNYNNIMFIKFVKEKLDNSDKDIIL